jgi:hypothetical protein
MAKSTVADATSAGCGDGPGFEKPGQAHTVAAATEEKRYSLKLNNSLEGYISFIIC